MPSVTIQNKLDQELQIFFSTAPDTEGGKASKNTNYYGTLISADTVSANSSKIVTLKNGFADVLIAFDSNHAPVKRYTWNLLDSTQPPDFTITEADVQVMTDCENFVKAVAKDPSGALAKSFQNVVSKGPSEVNKFFEGNTTYKDCQFQSYMLASTYESQLPATKMLPPDSKAKQYSLKELIEAISGLEYPSELPDIVVSNFYCEYVNSALKFGCTVNLDSLPFPSEAAKNAVKSWGVSTTLEVEVIFSTKLGPNIFGTEIIFLAQNFHIPVGDGKSVTLEQPHVDINITPLFKFVVFTAQTTIPFTIYEKQFDALASLTVDNVEAAVGVEISGDHTSLPSPPILKGIHFDEFGVNMGVIFEPPGFAVGVDGKFHIGSSSNLVALDDDTFCIVCEFEDSAPNPVYLSFYVPKLTISEVIEIFTNSNVNFGLPVEFEDLSFVWCEDPMEPVVLPDGSLSNGEFGFNGYMNIIGFKFFSNLQVSLNGIEGKAQMSPVDVGGVLKISGDSKPLTAKFDANGSMIKNNFVPTTKAQQLALKNATTKTIVPGGGPEMTVSTSKAPYLTMDASISLLGITDTVEAQVDPNGAHFNLSYGSILHTDIVINLKDFDNFSGKFGYGPDFSVHLTLLGVSMGNIHIDMTINAELGLAVQNEQADFSIGGGFDFEDLTLNFGPFTLDVNLTKIDQVLSVIEHGIVSDADEIFKDILEDAEKWAKWVKNEIIKGVQDVMRGLKDGFEKAYQDAAKVMHDVGYAAHEIAQGLRDVYKVGADVAADVLKGLGYAGDAISDVLHDVGYGMDEVVKGLKYIGYGAEDAARWVSGAFGVAAGALNSAMQDAGYAVDDIKNAFENIGGDLASFAKNTWDHFKHDINPSNW